MGPLTKEKGSSEIPEIAKLTEPWVKLFLEELGRMEWGAEMFVLTSDPSETGEEGGWIVRKLAASQHYHVGIGNFEDKDTKNKRLAFFIRTGGESVIAKDLTPMALKKALQEAINYGPTHIDPPGKIKKR